MDLPGGLSSQSALQQLKASLKQWERGFQTQHSRAPFKSDVQDCPPIQSLYRQYSRLKLKLANENQQEEEGEAKKFSTRTLPDLPGRHLDENLDQRDVIVKKCTNAELFPLQENPLHPDPSSSSSEDSGASHISATPPKTFPVTFKSRPTHAAPSTGIRRPLQLISSNDANQMPTLLNSNPKPSAIKCESRIKAVGGSAPKKSSLDAVVDVTSNEPASLDKGVVTANSFILEAGFTIRLQRHGERIHDEQSSCSDGPLPAGFRASSGPSSLLRMDRGACSIFSSENFTARDGGRGSVAPETIFVSGDPQCVENQVKSGDGLETHESDLNQMQCEHSFDKPDEQATQSFPFGVERPSNLVSEDDRKSATKEEAETRNAAGDLDRPSTEKNGHQMTSVVALKRMLLKLGLSVVGNKSILIDRLNEGLLNKKETEIASTSEDNDVTPFEYRKIGEMTAGFKHSKSHKRNGFKGPETQDEDNFTEPAENYPALSSMTAVVLKEMLRKRGLSSTGNKSTLIARLDEALITEGEPATAKGLDTKEGEPIQANKRTTDMRHTQRMNRKDSKGLEDQDEHIVSQKGESQQIVLSMSAIPANGRRTPVVARRYTRSMHQTKPTDEALLDMSGESPDTSLDASYLDTPESEKIQSPIASKGKRKSFKRAHDSSKLCKGATSNLTSDATGVNPLMSTVEDNKVSVIKASTKRIKISEPLEENSWANPKVLRKKAGARRGLSTGPARKPLNRFRERPVERDNFVRLNINGRGKRRKFSNGTRTKRPGAYGRRGNGGAPRSRKKFSRMGHTDEQAGGDNDVHHEGGYKSSGHCGPSGSGIGSLWTNDGWLEATTTQVLDNIKCKEADQLPARLKGAVEKVQKDPSDKNMMEVLHVVFGFKSFRAGQLEAIERVISMQSTMVILPTGAGKSLCYQISAYVLPGIILVISPLLALMNDQLRHLPPMLPGAVISSAQTSQESSAIIAQLRAGQIKILFISPERLFSESFLCILGELPKISLAVIDEAHCVSEWSHNFRPSYFRLGRVLQQRMKVSCVLAMTATATKRTQTSILKSLCIPADGVVQASHMRQNLLLSVSKEANRPKALLSMLKNTPYTGAKSIIIYCTFQVETDNISEYLQQNGIQAQSYHAKKSSQERTRIYDLFCSNKLRVVVATVAFGMGLDKSNVRAIIHYNMPRGLEQYVQETGRGGRDGDLAHCHLFLDERDYLKLRSLAHSDGVDEYSVNKLLSRVFEGCSSSTRPGKLVSIIIETACRELDMKEEVMETILSYLEVGETEYVKVLSKLSATCMLSFHQSNPQSLAKRNILVAAVLKRLVRIAQSFSFGGQHLRSDDSRRNLCLMISRSKERQGRYVFDLPSLATELRVSLFNVQSDLRSLQAAGEITYELSDSALCVSVLQIPEDICFLTSTITSRLTEAERCQVRRIDAMYLAASAAIDMKNKEGSQENPSSCQQTSLQNCITRYFEGEEDSLVSKNVPSIIQSQSSFVRADIKVFLSSARNASLNGRAVARIFHGLWSPAFPTSEWSKNHFWGLHSRVDFGVIKEAATAEILLQRRQLGEQYPELWCRIRKHNENSAPGIITCVEFDANSELEYLEGLKTLARAETS